MRYVFAGFEAGTSAFELARAGRPIEIPPKPLRFLLYLLSRAPAAVSVDELSAVLWPDETVTPNSLVQAVRIARRALGEDGASIIRTVRGHGYRLGVPVERHLESATAERWATEGPFVGRAALLAALERDVAAALGGSTRAILLAGEPGIGKTRTAEVLSTSESLEGAEVVWGRSLEGTGAPPLYPWRQILRCLVRGRNADVVRALLGPDLPVIASVSEELAALRTDSTPLPVLAADRQRFRLLEACAGLIRAMARERPLVLVLDDLHHADALSLALWEHIVRSAAPAPLLLIGAYRHVAAPPNPGLERVVSATATSPSAGSVLTLGGLDAPAVAEILEAVGGARAPDHLVKQVCERTGGNPLFVRALAPGIASRDDGEPVPESVVVAVRNRLRLLETGTRVVLEVASVIGRAFEVPVVAGASMLPRGTCIAALDDAFRAGLVISEDDGLRWRFVHMIVGEVLYAGLTPGRRSVLHAAVARALQLQFADVPDRVAGIVAEHFRKGMAAEAPETILRASLAAAAVAERSCSFEEAVQHRGTALVALDRIGWREPRTRFENLLRLARNHGFLGQHEARIDAGRRAFAVARELGPREVARAAIAIYDIKQWGMAREPEVNEILEEALARLPDEPSAERAHLLALRAHVNVYPQLEQAREQVQQAVQMARSYGGAVLQETLYIQHHVLGGPDFLDDREEIARELAACLDGGAGPESVLIALIDTACDRIVRGDARGADHWYRVAEAAAGSPPFPALEWYLRNLRAVLAHMRGEHDEGERISLEAFDIGTRVGQLQAPASRAAHMMILSDARGDPAYAADLVDVVLANRDVGAIEFAASAGADFSARAGRVDRAAAIVASLSKDAFRAIPRDLTWTATMVQLASAISVIGNERWATEVDALLEPVDSLHGVVPGAILYRGSVAGARARLLAVRGRTREAARAYRRAIDRERALGALPWAQENEERLVAMGIDGAA